jgi:hypothetical protein
MELYYRISPWLMPPLVVPMLLALVIAAVGVRSMKITTKFGKKLRVHSTFQIKHQLLLFWLKNQKAKEAAGAKHAELMAQASADRSR